MMRTRAGFVSGVAVIALTGCFTTTADFKKDAEAYITNSVAPEVDAAFQSVLCEQPLDQDVGTRFACSAIDADGGVWEFDNVIDAPGEFTINVARRP